MAEKTRDLLKGFVESTFTRSGGAWLARRRKRGDTLVLAYHNIVPTGSVIAGDRSLHLPQLSFARQLDALQRTHSIVPLAELLSSDSISPNSERPRVAITFDDACQGAVTAGIEDLASRGLPATVFVAPSFVGGRSFCWDALSGSQGLSDEDREKSLDMLAGLDDRIRSWALRSGRTLLEVPAHQTAATMEQLQRIDKLPGISLGSHTWSHPNLPRIPEEQLKNELSRPLEWLRENFQSVIPWLAYPYGLATPREMEAARNSGYEGALMVDGGWIPKWSGEPQDRYALPRLNVPAGLSASGFELRLAGLLTR